MNKSAGACLRRPVQEMRKEKHISKEREAHRCGFTRVRPSSDQFYRVLLLFFSTVFLTKWAVVSGLDSAQRWTSRFHGRTLACLFDNSGDAIKLEPAVVVMIIIIIIFISIIGRNGVKKKAREVERKTTITIARRSLSQRRPFMRCADSIRLGPFFSVCECVCVCVLLFNGREKNPCRLESIWRRHRISAMRCPYKDKSNSGTKRLFHRKIHDF